MASKLENYKKWRKELMDLNNIVQIIALMKEKIKLFLSRPKIFLFSSI
jgi:hypothetical protein